jgi:hypothetical protein
MLENQAGKKTTQIQWEWATPETFRQIFAKANVGKGKASCKAGNL